MRHSRSIGVAALFIAASSLGASAQTAAAPAAPQARGGAVPARRPPLFLKEEWKQNEKGDEHPATQDSVGNPNLELKLYGATGKDLQLTGKALCHDRKGVVASRLKRIRKALKDRLAVVADRRCFTVHETPRPSHTSAECLSD